MPDWPCGENFRRRKQIAGLGAFEFGFSKGGLPWSLQARLGIE
jgi:hypothetical protein